VKRFNAAFRLHPNSKTVRFYESRGVPDVAAVRRDHDIRLTPFDRWLGKQLEWWIWIRSAAASRPRHRRRLSGLIRTLGIDVNPGRALD
jgi:hypothetical protein